MPRKAKYSPEEIADTAFNSVRKYGADYLSTRNIAKELKTSTAPIFTAFSGIEEVKACVIQKAKDLYRTDYFEKALKEKPVFKSIGLKFIEFAKDEPELFKLIFMGECSQSCKGFMPEFDDTSEETLRIISNAYSLSIAKAKNLFNNISVYTYGLASLYAHKSYIFDKADISRMLTEAFNSFLNNEREKDDTGN